MRKVVAALLVTVVTVVLLAAYDTRPPATFSPESALRTPVPIRTPAATPEHPPGSITGRGPLLTTPFSSIQVQATLHRGRLIDVKTLSLTGADTHTRRSTRARSRSCARRR